MYIKSSIICVGILAIFATGCQVEKDIYNNAADSVTQEKTMTKVQNDVNEIIGKDYKYVLKNMGVPYKTNYFISLSELENIESTMELPYKVDVKLVYPKSVVGKDEQSSALYINVKDNEVYEVKTGIFSKDDSSFLDKKSEVRIEQTDTGVIEKYASDIDRGELNRYIGSETKRFESLISNDSSNLKIYDKDQNLKGICFLLKKDDKNISDKLITVLVSDNKIKSIQVVNQSKAIKLICNHLSNSI